MDFYHSFIYLSILNTEWFMWIIVGSVLGINFIAPVIVWYLLNGKKWIRKFKELRRQ